MKLDWCQSILPVTIMGAECCWLYALLMLLNKQVVDGRLSVPWFLLVYPLAFIFNTLLPKQQWSKVKLYAANGLAWAIGMLLMVKTQLYSGLGLFEPGWLLAFSQALSRILQTVQPEVILLVGSIVLWWLGWRLARLRITFTTSVTEFQFGVIVLLIIFASTAQLGIQFASSVPMAMVFFLFALGGIAIAHTQGGVSWLTGSGQGFWLGLLFAGIGLILLLALLIGSIITPDFFQLILIPLKWIGGVIAKGFELLMQVIDYLMSLFGEPEPAELPPGMTIPAPPPSEPDIPMRLIPESVRNGLRLGWYILMVGGILYALWSISSQIFGWLRRRLAAAGGAEFEPLPGAFKADLLVLLRLIMNKLRGLRLLLWWRRKPEPILSETASVRQIYRQFLRWAARSGWPRHLSQTPHEYLQTLEALLPVAHGELRFITEQYVSVRYSPALPTDEELHRLRQSWHQVKRNRLKGPDSEIVRQ